MGTSFRAPQSTRGPASVLLEEERVRMTAIEQNKIIDEVLDETLGLRPLEPLLKEPSISDSLVNRLARARRPCQMRLHGLFRRKSASSPSRIPPSRSSSSALPTATGVKPRVLERLRVSQISVRMRLSTKL